MDLLKQGMKIDVYDDGLKQWMAGDIEALERVNALSAKLVVTKENMPEDSKESIVWPNSDKLDFCGVQVKKRECGEDKAPAVGAATDKKGPTIIKIDFALSGAPQGYFQD